MKVIDLCYKNQSKKKIIDDYISGFEDFLTPENSKAWFYAREALMTDFYDGKKFTFEKDGIFDESIFGKFQGNDDDELFWDLNTVHIMDIYYFDKYFYGKYFWDKIFKERKDDIDRLPRIFSWKFFIRELVDPATNENHTVLDTFWGGLFSIWLEEYKKAIPFGVYYNPYWVQYMANVYLKFSNYGYDNKPQDEDRVSYFSPFHNFFFRDPKRMTLLETDGDATEGIKKHIEKNNTYYTITGNNSTELYNFPTLEGNEISNYFNTKFFNRHRYSYSSFSTPEEIKDFLTSPHGDPNGIIKDSTIYKDMDEGHDPSSMVVYFDMNNNVTASYGSYTGFWYNMSRECIKPQYRPNTFVDLNFVNDFYNPNYNPGSGSSPRTYTYTNPKSYKKLWTYNEYNNHEDLVTFRPRQDMRNVLREVFLFHNNIYRRSAKYYKDKYGIVINPRDIYYTVTDHTNYDASNNFRQLYYPSVIIKDNPNYKTEFEGTNLFTSTFKIIPDSEMERMLGTKRNQYYFFLSPKVKEKVKYIYIMEDAKWSKDYIYNVRFNLDNSLCSNELLMAPETSDVRDSDTIYKINDTRFYSVPFPKVIETFGHRSKDINDVSTVYPYGILDPSLSNGYSINHREKTLDYGYDEIDYIRVNDNGEMKESNLGLRNYSLLITTKGIYKRYSLTNNDGSANQTRDIDFTDWISMNRDDIFDRCFWIKINPKTMLPDFKGKELDTTETGDDYFNYMIRHITMMDNHIYFGNQKSTYVKGMPKFHSRACNANVMTMIDVYLRSYFDVLYSHSSDRSYSNLLGEYGNFSNAHWYNAIDTRFTSNYNDLIPLIPFGTSDSVEIRGYDPDREWEFDEIRKENLLVKGRLADGFAIKTGIEYYDADGRSIDDKEVWYYDQDGETNNNGISPEEMYLETFDIRVGTNSVDDDSELVIEKLDFKIPIPHSKVILAEKRPDFFTVTNSSEFYTYE